MKRSTKQRGDTLIEVLLAMSVIGLVLAASFGIANRASRTGQAAQERTEALKIAESQLELTKAYLKDTGNNIDGFGSTFCVDDTQPAASAAVSSSDPRCVNVDGDGGSGLYTISITENVGTYAVNVQWDRVNTESDERGTVTLYYRVGVL